MCEEWVALKEINNRQEGVELDLCTLTGRYYEMPCCGWRNQAGRSQPGDWHISVGDEVKAAFKLLRVNLHTGTQTYGIYTDIYKHTYDRL